MLRRTSDHLAERMERGDVFEPRCPSRIVLRHVTSSWSVLAMIALKSGTLRFSELRRMVSGVSERMLAQTLRQLEASSLVIRRSHPVVPPHVDYTLTDLGREAADQIEQLANWIEDNLPALIGPSTADQKDED